MTMSKTSGTRRFGRTNYGVVAVLGFLVGLLVVLRIYVALPAFQPYRELEAGNNQSLKFKWRGGESNPEPLAPQAKKEFNHALGHRRSL